MTGKEALPDDEDDTVLVGSDDTVVGSDNTVIRSDKTVITSDSASKATQRLIESPLSDEDRKRFFRPPVAPPGATVPVTPREIPPTTRPVHIAEPVADEPRKRKSFDEIISGEFHRMTDAIPLVGRNSKGEPRRAAVVVALVIGLAVVAGVVVTVAMTFAFA